MQVIFSKFFDFFHKFRQNFFTTPPSSPDTGNKAPDEQPFFPEPAPTQGYMPPAEGDSVLPSVPFLPASEHGRF